MTRKLKFIWMICAMCSLAACQSALDIDPRQSIDSERALTTPEGVNAAVTNIYSSLKTQVMYGRDLVATTEALGDNSRIINRAGGRYLNQGNNVIGNHVGGWATYYSTINEINLLLEALPKVNLTEARRSQIEGEVRCIRALLYFNLMRVYSFDPNVRIPALDKGGVPLMTSGVSDLSQVTQPARSPIADVYRQIYQDLTEATQKAPTTGGPHRITRGAAFALFAKVALYNGDWANASRYATEAINSNVGRLTTAANLVAAWRERSHQESIFEVLFQLEAESQGVNESVQSAFTTRVSLTSTSLAGWGAVVPTPELLALHQPGDVRRQLYQNGVSRAGAIVEECTKFMGKTGTIYMDNIPVFRVPEMVLIRAEAQARLGNAAQALADVNTIRTRCGLQPVANLAGDALLEEIILQRRLELAFEGDRWFDLKRLGRDVIKATGNLQYGDPRYLAAIPLREIQANPNLVQNNGY